MLENAVYNIFITTSSEHCIELMDKSATKASAPVSYTHLDVYKRQNLICSIVSLTRTLGSALNVAVTFKNYDLAN